MTDGIEIRSHTVVRASRLATPSTDHLNELHDRSADEAPGTQAWNQSTGKLPSEEAVGIYGCEAGDSDTETRLENDRGDNNGSETDYDEEHDPAKMSTWAGQPKVEGSSETVRMVLLTCVSIGITFVHVDCAATEHGIADLVSAVASLGVLR